MFKKLNLILMSALVFGFAACDDIDDAVAPQSYAPEALMSLDGLTVEKGAALSGETIDLNEVSTLEVIKTVATPELRAGQSVEYVMQVSGTADFANAKSLEVEGNSVYASDLNTVFRELLGKTDKARELHVRFAAYLAYGDGARVRFGEQDTYFAASAMNVIPFTPELFIDETYHLLINGQVRATLANTGGDVYDNPVFEVTAEITDEDFDMETFMISWQIIADTYKETGDASAARMVFAPSPDAPEALAGSLVTNSGAEDIPAAGALVQSGSLVFTIDVENMTYSVAEAPAYLWTPGDANGWEHAKSQVLTSADKVNYQGMAHLNGGFKFTNVAGWDGTNYGDSGTPGLLSTDGGAGNLNVESDGLYWCNANVLDLTYSLTPINTVGVIGSFSASGWGTDVVMTPSPDFLVYTAEVTFAEGDMWKIRTNGTWDINFGGSADGLVFNAGDIAAPGAGTYEIVVDFSKIPYTATLTKK